MPGADARRRSGEVAHAVQQRVDQRAPRRRPLGMDDEASRLVSPRAGGDPRGRSRAGCPRAAGPRARRAGRRIDTVWPAFEPQGGRAAAAVAPARRPARSRPAAGRGWPRAAQRTSQRSRRAPAPASSTARLRASASAVTAGSGRGGRGLGGSLRARRGRGTGRPAPSVIAMNCDVREPSAEHHPRDRVAAEELDARSGRPRSSEDVGEGHLAVESLPARRATSGRRRWRAWPRDS